MPPIGGRPQAPKPQPKLKRPPVVVPRPEVSVQAPKPPKPQRVGTKSFPAPKPEVTRPVSKALQAQVDYHTELANRAYHIKQAMDAENRAEGHYYNVAGISVHPEASLAAGLNYLNIAATPLHAIAGAANEAAGRGFKGLTPRQLVKGAGEGIKQKTTYSNVLQTAGVRNKAVRGVAGFAGDVLLDPTTYLTFGTTSLAKEAATKAGTRIAEKALAQGMTHDVAHRLATQGAKKAAKEAEGGMVQRAVTVGVGKRKLKIVPLPAKREAGALRSELASAVSPRYVHPLADEAAQLATKSAHLEARSAASAGARRVIARAQQLNKLKPAEHEQIVNALETGAPIKSLPERLRDPAIRLRSDFRNMVRTERQQGVASREIQNYVPHVRRQDTQLAEKITVGRGQANPANLASSKARKVKGTLSEIQQHSPDLFSGDLPSIYALRGRASAEGVARSKLFKEVAATGRKLTPGAQIDTAKELVYKVTPTGLKPLVKEGGDKLDLQAIEKAAQGGAGQHVILNKRVVSDLQQRLATPTTQAGKLAKGYIDRPMGGLKSALTVLNPPYHFRNLVGDSWNSYLYQTAPSLFANFKHALGANVRLSKIRGAEETLAAKPAQAASKHGVTIGGQKVSYDELARRARDAGVVDSGFYGRDIVELVKGPITPKHHPLDFIRRVGQWRENVVRLNTFTAALKRGLSDREAARTAMTYHFDYGDLSQLERNVLRRIFPFYTFRARNIPLQARSLVTKPGKYANLEKAREELAKGAGLGTSGQGDYQKNLHRYEQLGQPFPIPGLDVGGKKQLGYLSLPTTDLNVLTANPKSLAGQVMQSATPFKLPIEVADNYSFFFQGPIDQGRPVAAPDWVGGLPGWAKSKLGVVKALDKRSGQHIWKWSAKADYIAKQLPQSSFLLGLMSSGANRRGQGTAAKIVSQTGVRVQPYDPLSRKLDDLYKFQTKLQNQRSVTDPGSPQRQAVNKQLSAVAQAIVANKQKQGYKVVGSTKKKNPYDQFFVQPAAPSSGSGKYDQFFK